MSAFLKENADCLGFILGRKVILRGDISLQLSFSQQSDSLIRPFGMPRDTGRNISEHLIICGQKVKQNGQ